MALVLCPRSRSRLRSELRILCSLRCVAESHPLPFTMSACNSRTTLCLRDPVRVVDRSFDVKAISETLGPFQSSATSSPLKTDKTKRAYDSHALLRSTRHYSVIDVHRLRFACYVLPPFDHQNLYNSSCDMLYLLAFVWGGTL